MSVSDPVVLSHLSTLPSGLDTLLLSASHMRVDFSKKTYDSAGWTEVADMSNANVTGSRLKGSNNRHALLLDIDHPAWLLPSTTPGNHHLYVDIDCDWTKLERFLFAAADIGLIERAYAQASHERGWTSLRLPWVPKAAA